MLLDICAPTPGTARTSVSIVVINSQGAISFHATATSATPMKSLFPTPALAVEAPLPPQEPQLRSKRVISVFSRVSRVMGRIPAPNACNENADAPTSSFIDKLLQSVPVTTIHAL